MKPSVTARSECGFALVLTISLLALLVLIVFAISNLSRVDAMIADSASQQRRARQNALVGLRQAIDRLQMLAGPDQRTTANAAIRRSADSPDQNPLLDNDGRKFWTGVWDSSGTRLEWLVSGPQSDSTDPIADSMPDNPAVLMVGPGSLGGGTTMLASYVRVQAEPIRITSPRATDQLTGHYAYWVGDEGVKVSTAVFDTIEQIDYPNGDNQWNANQTRLRQQLLARPQIEAVFSSVASSGRSAYDRGVQEGLQKALMSEQLALVTNTATGTTVFSSSLGQRFFDATLLASNVLADPVHGGLKQDLSDPAVSPTLLTPSQLSWMTTRPSVMGTQGPVTYDMTSVAGGSAIVPVLTELQLRIGFRRDSSTGRLTIKTQLQAELWNPYNASIRTTAFTGPLSFRIRGLPQHVALDFTNGAPSITEIDLQRHLDSLHFELPVDGELAEFGPGQIIAISGVGDLNAGTGTAGSYADYLDVSGSSVIISGGSPRGMIIRDDSALDNALSIEVDMVINDVVVGTYAPSNAYAQPVPVTQASFNTLATATYTYGWAFALRDTIEFWSYGGAGSACDPRAVGLAGLSTDLFEEFNGSSAISEQPVSNATRSIATSGTGRVFAQGNSGDYVLFELPQRSVLSIGNLQHAIPSSVGPPNTIGNPWGGADNALFDRAYFSGVPRQYLDWDGATLSRPKSVPTNAPVVSGGGTPLPNSFLRLPVTQASTSRGALLDGTGNAQFFMQAGGFNVNSISPAAWEAMLGGNAISGWAYSGATINSTRDLDHAYFRFAQSGAYSNYFDSGFSTSVGGSSSSRWVQGVRDVSDSYIAPLAKALVGNIRARGRPYLSLQEFLNDGAIDRAISDANINGVSGIRGSPYFLSQADIVSLIGPALASRSDTFRIRAYGDALNPVTGEVEARAWCEVLVQRTPELINATLGRRFTITYFRWLGPDDI